MTAVEQTCWRQGYECIEEASITLELKCSQTLSEKI